MTIHLKNIGRLLSLMLLASTLFCMTSCNDNDNESLYSIWETSINNHGSDFTFDAQGRCYATGSIGATGFDENFVGHGWKHYATWEISEDGKRLPREYYTEIVGVSPHQFYIGTDHTITTYYISDAEAMAKKSDTVSFTFNDTYADPLRGSIMCVDGSYIQIIGWTTGTCASFCAIEHLGTLSDGRKIYGVSIYEKMSDKELATYQSTYHE